MAGKAVISLATGLEDLREGHRRVSRRRRRRRVGPTDADVPHQGSGPARARRHRHRRRLRRLPAARATSSSATRRPGAATTCARSASTPRSSTTPTLIAGAEVQGTLPLWNWIGDERDHDIQLLTDTPRAAQAPSATTAANRSRYSGQP